MEYFKKLVGDRIYLSPVVETEEEAKKFTEWMNNSDVTDYTGSKFIVSAMKQKLCGTHSLNIFLRIELKKSTDTKFDIYNSTTVSTISPKKS